MFSGEPRQRIYKQGSCRQTGEAYGDNLGNWAVTRHRGITVPEKPRLRELWQLIGQDIFTNDSSLSSPGLSQAAGHPESRGKSTANPTSSVFLEWGRGQRTRSLSTPINPLPKSLEQTSPHTFTCEWRQCAICLFWTIQMAIGEEPERRRINLTTDVFELEAHCLCCSQKGLWRNATISSACELPGPTIFILCCLNNGRSQTGSFRRCTYRWIVPKSDSHHLRRELFESSSHVIIFHRGWPLGRCASCVTGNMLKVKQSVGSRCNPLLKIVPLSASH